MNLNLIFKGRSILSILMFVICLGMSSIPLSADAQTVKEKDITIQAQNETVVNTFDKISQLTHFKFFYDQEVINKTPRITLRLKNATINEVLNAISNQSQLIFNRTNNTISVSKGKQSAQRTQGQPQSRKRTVSGVVVDEKGDPIIGASVAVQGTNNGVVTDVNGHYVLPNVPEGSNLAISYIGYKTSLIASGSNAKVVMKEDTQTLDEVVVVGFGTQKKANLTGAVSQVSMDKTLGDRPITSLGSALQGAMAGFTASSSAIPGGGNSFNIRGLESINGGSPLVLVDNVVYNDLYLLNPADIESVSVLKDASSAAIYGARASFGVILITTKKAKKNETLSINYNNNFAASYVNNLPKLASPIEMITTLKEGGYSSIWSGQNIDTYMDVLQKYNADPSIYPDGWTAVNGTKYFLKQTNIQKDMFETAWKQTHNISAQGGSERIMYRMSAAYTTQNGVLVTNKDSFRRVNVSSYVSGDITKWLSTSIDFSYNKGNKKYPIFDSNSEMGIWHTNLPSYFPTYQIPYGTDGDLYTTMAPANLIRLTDTEKTITDDTRILSRTVLKPFKGFEGVLEYSYQVGHNDYESYCNKYLVHQGLAESIKPSTTLMPFTRTNSTSRYTTINAYATYNNTFNQVHNVSAIAGYNQEKSTYRYLYSQAYNMISNELPSLSGSTGTTPPSTYDSYDDYALRSGFFRATYNYNHRYFLEVDGRYDLSSKFPKDYRDGFFPSVSVGWTISEEPFMKSFSGWLSMLKLRGSYGTLGNQNIGNYGYYATMGVVDANWLTGGTQPKTLNAPGMVRANYTWEKVRTLNGGIDFGFLNSKLNGTFDIYRRNTIGMLGPGEDLPAVGGATAPTQNAANMRTTGWELSLNWRDRIGKVDYGISVNLYDNKSVITKYKNDNKLLSNYYDGMKVGDIWGYLTDGFYTANDFDASGALKSDVVAINGVTSHEGDIKYKNLMDDENYVNKITTGNNTLANPGDRVVIGNSRARWQYGANGFVSYKGFNFSFILQGVGKRDAWIGGDITFPMSSQYSTVYKSQVGKIWTSDNPNAKYGRIYENAGSSQGANQYVSDKFLYNAAYLRVKNITLSYTFPAQLTQKLMLKNLKLFFSGEDLFTFDHLPDGIDPENLGWTYPHSKTLSFGINFTL